MRNRKGLIKTLYPFTPLARSKKIKYLLKMMVSKNLLKLTRSISRTLQSESQKDTGILKTKVQRDLIILNTFVSVALQSYLALK